jgi:glycosyltransferase involved in cell wall biosynthesis
MTPKVSVVIPAYNKAELTRRTVDSVLRQTYPNLEIIVVDDGSKDDTRQAMLSYGNKIIYLHKSNGGACSARNEGIRNASGEYIAFLDCDDLYLPDKIELCVRYLDHHPVVGFVHTSAYFIDGKDKVLSRYSHPRSLRHDDATKRLILKNFICNSTVVARKECIDKAGYFDESIFVPADWDMWLRMSETAEVGYIDSPLTMYRVTDNYTFNKLDEAQKEELIVIEKFFARNPQLASLRAMAMSCWSLRFAQCRLLKNDLDQFRSLIFSALRIAPLNFMALLQAFYFLVAPTHYKNQLHKKIIRHNETK